MVIFKRTILFFLVIVSIHQVKTFDLQTEIFNAVSNKSPVFDIPYGNYTMSNTLYVYMANNLVIRGNGARIITSTGVTQKHSISITSSKNVTIENLEIDYDPLPFTQGRITNLVTGSNYFDVTIDSGYPTNITLFGKYCYIQFFDAAKRQFKGDSASITGTTNALSQVSPGVFRITEPNLSYFNISLNDIVAIGQPGFSCGFSLWNSTGTKLTNVKIFSAPGCGILEAGGGGTVIDNLKIKRGPTPDGSTQARLMSTNRDGIHLNGPSGGTIIKNSYMEFTGDDAVNVRSSFSKITQVNSTGYIQFDLNWIMFNPGDDLNVYNSTTLKRKDTVKVLSRTLNTNFCIVNKTTNIAVGDLIISPQSNTGSHIINNVFTDIDARGILASGSNIYIMNNTIQRTTINGIWLGVENGHYSEGDFINGIYVQGNIINNVGYTKRARNADQSIVGAITVNSDVLPAQVSSIRGTRESKNLFIQNNFINSSGLTGIFVGSIENVVICNNNVLNTNYLSQNSAGTNYFGFSTAYAIYFYDSNNVSLSQNTIQPGIYATGLNGSAYSSNINIASLQCVPINLSNGNLQQQEQQKKNSALFLRFHESFSLALLLSFLSLSF